MGNEKFTDVVVNQHPMSRRSFVKGVIGAAGSLSLAACSKNDSGEIILNQQPVQEDPVFEEEKVVSSVCRNNCTSICHLNAHVRKGRVVRVSKASMMPKQPDSNYTREDAQLDSMYDRICLRGLSHPIRMYHSSRITTPLIQTNRENRNKGDISTFRKATWDEAITLVASKIWETYDSAPDGNQKIARVFGTGNYGSYNNFVGLTWKLFSALGASTIDGTFDLALCYGVHRVVGFDKAPFFFGNEIADYRNAEAIFSWGCNITESAAPLWRFMADAIENGATHINIDPRFTTTSSKADYHVTLNPGSDAILVMAMMQYIIANDMLDVAFMKESTVAPFLVHPTTFKFLRKSDFTGVTVEDDYVGWDTNLNSVVYSSKDSTTKSVFADYASLAYDGGYNVTLSDGTTINCKTSFQLLKERVQKYTPEIQKDYTGVNADVVVQLAKMYAGDNINNIGGGKRVTVIPFFGPDHYLNGLQFYHALVTMAAITNKIGRTGCSVSPSVPFGHMVSDAMKLPPLNSKTAGPNVSTMIIGDAVKEKNFKGQPYDIKFMYVCGCNPTSSYSDQKRIWHDTVIPNLDLFVVADNEFSDTARYADVILPVCHWFEMEEVTVRGTHPFALKQDKAVDTLGQSLSDSSIARLIAAKLQELSGGKLNMEPHFNDTDENYLRGQLRPDNGLYLPTGVGNPNVLGVTYDDIDKNKAVRIVPYSAGKKPFILGEGGFYSTPSRRLEFYTEPDSLGMNIPLSTYAYTETPEPLTPEMVQQQVLPDWFAPDEVWLGKSDKPEDDARFKALREKYPFQMFQEHTRWRIHTTWFNNEWLRELDPYATVEMNPDDANAKGFKSGDKVKLSNERGHVVLPLRINNGLPKGMVNVPKGWQRHQVAENGGSGGYSELTNPKGHRTLFNQPFFDVLVNITKI